MKEEKISRRRVFERAGQSLISSFASYLEKKTKKTFFRPPKSVDEEVFLPSCQRCEDCIDACPHNVIFSAESETGIHYGTPILDFKDNYCRLCFSCVKACKEDVLKEENEINLGKSKIIKGNCLAYQGGLCKQCYYNCPRKDKALILKAGKPVIEDKVCVGCNACYYFCPQTPSAIKINLD